jgi:hypothetical protein
MFTKKHFINTNSILFLIVINIIYLFDGSFSSLLIPVIYLVILLSFFYLLIFYLDKRLGPGEKIIRKNFIFFFLLILTMFIVFELAFTPNQGISFFTTFGWLTNLVNGVFPYNNNYPHNLPFLYYIDAPFYLLGNAGIISLFGLALFFLLILELSITKKELVVRVIVFMLLPIIYCEIVTGGDSLANAVLIVSIIFIINRFIDAKKIDIKFFFLSIVFGVLLCTRLVALIPFSLSVLFFFRYNFKYLLIFLILSLIICFALLIPFIRWDYSSFMHFGPFNGNIAELHFWVYILIIGVVLYTGWMISDLQELFFSSGVILFFVSLITFFRNGNYFEEMVFSIPFFILSIKEYEIDKFLGKKIPIIEDH